MVRTRNVRVEAGLDPGRGRLGVGDPARSGAAPPSGSALKLPERVVAERALRANEEFTRRILESSPDCIKVMSLDARLEFFSEGGLCAMEVDDFDCELRGAAWPSFWRPEDQPKVQAAIATALAGGIGRFQAFCPTAKGTPKWWDVSVTAMRDANGAPEKLLSISRDITEQHRTEERLQLLVGELNHRVKNLFAIAVGMVNMTGRSATSTRDMVQALTGRLMALAKAHDLIRPAVTQEQPKGDGALLQELVTAVVSPHLALDSEGLRIEGPALRLGPNAATSLTLVLHELATNAAKYGALSVPQGSLAVAWEVRDGTVCLTWDEGDGPPVEAAPERHGFGSQLARLTMTGQLGGEIAYAWERAGARIRLTLPLARLEG